MRTIAHAAEGDAFHFLRFAIEYHAAAQAVDDRTEFKRDSEDTFRPAMFLIGQSIELALKAYLRRSGTARDVLKKQYGHNLRTLLRRAERLGLDIAPLDQADREALIDANVLFKQKRLQYCSPDSEVWPDFNSLSRLAAVIIHRAAETLPIALLFLGQEHAESIRKHLSELNKGIGGRPFELLGEISREDVINGGRNLPIREFPIFQPRA